jgi:hypothetical protein
MRNYALQRGPCNFLDLRISPWENSISPSSLFSLYLAPFLFLPTGGISLSLASILISTPAAPLSLLHAALAVRAGAGAGTARAPAREQAAPSGGQLQLGWRRAARLGSRRRRALARARGRLAAPGGGAAGGGGRAGRSGAHVWERAVLAALAWAWRGRGRLRLAAPVRRARWRPGHPSLWASPGRGMRWHAGAQVREEVRRSTGGSAWTSRETMRPPCEGAAARAARAALERGAGSRAERGTGGSVQARARMWRCCSVTVRGGPAQVAVEPRVEDVGGR